MSFLEPQYIEQNQTALEGWFSPNIKSVRLLNRIPSDGLPVFGTPLTLEVEVNVDRTIGSQIVFKNLFSSPVSCPDVVIAVQDKESGKFLGFSDVNTTLLSGCIGKAFVTLDKAYRPSKSDSVHILVYDEGTSFEEIKNGAHPIYESQEYFIGLDKSEAEKMGLYSSPTAVFGFNEAGFTNPFAAIDQGIGQLFKYGAIAFGGYLLWSNREFIDKEIKKVLK